MADSLYVMPFGKYKGQGIEDLPDSYLIWLAEQTFFERGYPDGLKAVETELKFRDKWDR